jgi:acylphosphatase
LQKTPKEGERELANEEQQAHLLRSHAFISGDVVQEAAFLERVRRQAEELDLRGWVRRTQDGRVEALLEGEAEAVRQMIKWFFSASSGVEVHFTSVYQETPSSDLVGFEIR